jgi:4-amino-4-deoxy-L-arabinose transferase-like glycosyltransferase
MSKINPPVSEKAKASLSIHWPLFAIIFYITLIQGLMFIYDLSHPNLFLFADRAADRIEAIKRLITFLQGHSSLMLFLSHQGTALGVPGDYIIQGLVFFVSGQYGVILFQIVLFIASVAALYHLTYLLTHSRYYSIAAALIYAHLPHSIVFPHMLWSEALFNPFVLFGYYYMVRAAISSASWLNISLAALFLALATLVRIVSAPLVIVGVIIFLLCHLPLKKIGGYVSIFAVALVVWPLFVWSQTGLFAMGSRDRTGSSHLYYGLVSRLKTMISTLPRDQRPKAEEKYVPTENLNNEQLKNIAFKYLSFAMNYPGPFVRLLAQDAAIFVSQSGVERITVDYLELAGTDRKVIQQPLHGWRENLVAKGIIDTASTYLHEHRVVVVLSLIGMLAMLALCGLTAVGAISVWKNWLQLGREERIILASMAFFVVYIFLPGTMVLYPGARYRSPAEPYICVLAAIGLASMKKLRKIGGAKV